MHRPTRYWKYCTAMVIRDGVSERCDMPFEVSPDLAASGDWCNDCVIAYVTNLDPRTMAQTYQTGHFSSHPHPSGVFPLKKDSIWMRIALGSLVSILAPVLAIVFFAWLVTSW